MENINLTLLNDALPKSRNRFCNFVNPGPIPEDLDYVPGVPDSLLKGFCAHVTDMCGENHAIAGRERTVITKHINNVFKEGELPREGFVQILHKTSEVGGRPVILYNLDVIISVGYRVKSFQGTRFRQWATRILREMLLNRLDEVKRIGNLERRMDAEEGDIKQIKVGMNYLVQQLSAPPDPPRKRIGFNNGGSSSTKPYGKK